MVEGAVYHLSCGPARPGKHCIPRAKGLKYGGSAAQQEMRVECLKLAEWRTARPQVESVFRREVSSHMKRQAE